MLAIARLALATMVRTAGSAAVFQASQAAASSASNSSLALGNTTPEPCSLLWTTFSTSARSDGSSIMTSRSLRLAGWPGTDEGNGAVTDGRARESRTRRRVTGTTEWVRCRAARPGQASRARDGGPGQDGPPRAGRTG
ncbi:hypothetical protein A6A07_39945 [Streptomyces sp. CB03911]|nr:hypothetical protein A6A07_39945 [Streptomyces sp. CB03911]